MTLPDLPREGARCLCSVSGPWAPGTVRRAIEDGTYIVELDEKEEPYMPCWYGVTAAEISIDDEAAWPEVYARLCEGEAGFGWAALRRALARVGNPTPAARVDAFFRAQVAELLSVTEEEAAAKWLDPAEAHRLIVRAGLSAKVLGAPRPDDSGLRPHMLYWNQLRMGGRSPAEVKRPVTLDDARRALGLSDAGVDPAVSKALDAFEARHGVRVPRALRDFFTAKGAASAVTRVQPNNPVPVAVNAWELRRGLRELGVEGDLGIVIMKPHQGEHLWVAVFDEGDAEARIHLCFDAGDADDEETGEREVLRLTAVTVPFFFWDLAQTGLARWPDLGDEVRVTTTDIGLAVDTTRRWRDCWRRWVG